MTTSWDKQLYIKHTPWAVCILIVLWRKLACFNEPQFGQISLNISLSDSVLVLNFTCQTISVCELWQIVNFDGLTFLTAVGFWLAYRSMFYDSIEHAEDIFGHVKIQICK